MKTKLIIFFGSLFFLAFTVKAVITHYVTADKLNVRSQPNTTATIKTTLNKGAGVTVNFETGDWANITVYDTLKGYVAKEHLSTQKPSAAKQAPPKETTVIICNSKSAYAYHSHYCHGLNRCKAGTSNVTKTQAQNSGYRACKICY